MCKRCVIYPTKNKVACACECDPTNTSSGLCPKCGHEVYGWIARTSLGKLVFLGIVIYIIFSFLPILTIFIFSWFHLNTEFLTPVIFLIFLFFGGCIILFGFATQLKIMEERQVAYWKLILSQIVMLLGFVFLIYVLAVSVPTNNIILPFSPTNYFELGSFALIITSIAFASSNMNPPLLRVKFTSLLATAEFFLFAILLSLFTAVGLGDNYIINVFGVSFVLLGAVNLFYSAILMLNNKLPL